MVGSAIVRQLESKISEGEKLDLITRSRSELDLTHQASVIEFLSSQKPDLVIIAAARVGGIHANNKYPAEFIYDNLMIECNMIHGAFKAGVRRLLQLGSSCIYPKDAPQPILESCLLTGKLESTNEPYAVAKIAGIKLCESYNRQYGVDYRSIMPTNLYGPGDNFHPENSHVLPALIRRIHEAKVQGLDEIKIWGSGTPRREFLHVDDMAEASLFVLSLPKTVFDATTQEMTRHINVGSGADISVLDLAHLIASVIGYDGVITTEPEKPDGTMRKLLDTRRLNSLGWHAKIGLEQGISETYSWFLLNQRDLRVK